jgi:hypothetical protein
VITRSKRGMKVSNFFLSRRAGASHRVCNSRHTRAACARVFCATAISRV